MRSSAELTPQNSVLVLVDYLDGLYATVGSSPASVLKNNAAAFASLGKAFALPTIVMGDEGEQTGKYDHDILTMHADAPRFPRTSFSCFRAPKFADYLHGLQRTNVLVAGIATDVCVMQTVLDLLDAGYVVHVAVDASGTSSILAENAAIARFMEKGAVVNTWIGLAAELIADWASPTSPRLQQVFEQPLDAGIVRDSSLG